MFDFHSAEILPLTEKLAEKHTKMQAVPAERPLEEPRLQELDQEIDEGTFYCPEWAIAVLPNGKEFRADGHHSATALLRAAQRGKFPVGAKVLIKRYKIDTLEEDGSALFLRLDDSSAVRKAVATINAVSVRWGDLRDVSPKFRVIATSGIVYHLRERNQRQQDPSLKVKILKPKLRGYYLRDKNYRTFVNWLNHWNTLTGDDGEHRKALNEWLLKRPEVVAEAMANYFAYSEVAKIFWNYMLDDAGPKGHPTKELVARFNEWRSRSRDKKPKPEQWRSAINVAWKLFLQEQDKGKGKK